MEHTGNTSGSHSYIHMIQRRANNPTTTIDYDRLNPQSPSALDYIYYTIQPGDTLHNLSVRYSCPVASIKRLNNLWSDQEFYGLSRIKLPVGRFRLIADAIIDGTLESNNRLHDYTNNPSSSIETASIPNSSSNHPISKQASHVNSNFHGHTFSGDPDDQAITQPDKQQSNSVFKDYDVNIEKARAAARLYNSEAIKQSLAASGNFVDDEDDNPNKLAQREAETLLNDMSDYGLSYSGLILFIFIVCLICPLAYVIYLEETVHHDSNKVP